MPEEFLFRRLGEMFARVSLVRKGAIAMLLLGSIFWIEQSLAQETESMPRHFEPQSESKLDLRSEQEYDFAIEAVDVVQALIGFGEQAKLSVLIHPDARDQQVNSLNGSYSVSDALQRLLAGTGLSYRIDRASIIITRTSDASDQIVPLSSGKVPPTESNTSSYLRRFIMALAATLMTSAVPAAELPVESIDQTKMSVMEEVVVTARRRAETEQSVPIPTTALSGDSLANRSIRDIREIARVTPNLSFSGGAGNKGSAQVFLRGIGQTNWSPTQDPKVGIYLDGVYLGRPQGAVFDLVDVDRIEVLRGPQGTLFGRNTTAGLIHVITKKPQHELSADLRAGVGNDGQLDVSGVFNLPITDELAMRFSLQHRESDGYVKNLSTGRDWNDENSDMLRASLDWNPGANFNLLMSFDYQRTRELAALGKCEWTGPDNGALTGATGGLPFIAYVFGIYDQVKDTCNATEAWRSTENDPRDESNIDAYGVNLTMNWEMGVGTLTSISSYRQVTDFNGSWGLGTDAIGTPSYFEVLGETDSHDRQWSQEIRLAGDNGSTLNWIVGVFGFEEKAQNPLAVPAFRGVQAPSCADWPVFCAPAGATTLGAIALQTQLFGSRNQNYEGNNSSAAVFGELNYRFAEGWEVTAGVRYTRDNRKVWRTQQLTSGALDPAWVCPDGSAPVDGIRCDRETSYSKVTPRVIVAFNVDDEKLLYAGWSRGYSSGGFNQSAPLRPFEPEVSDNLEAGLKSMWLEQRLRLNLTAFRNDYKNQQVTVTRIINGRPTGDLLNAQKALLYGVEGELRLVLSANWWIDGSFGWIDGKYDKFDVTDVSTGPPPDFATVSVQRDLSSTNVIRDAPYTYSLSTTYSHHIAALGEIRGQLGWSYRGRTYFTLESRSTSRQDAYGLMDANLTWNLPNGKTTVSLWGTNLLNEQYFTNAYDFSGEDSTALFWVTKYYAAPRRVGLEIKYNFSE